MSERGAVVLSTVGGVDAMPDFVPASTTDNPFPGMRSFDMNQTHLFFGREQQIFKLLNKLRTHHFVTVVGASGAGKSSVVRAGVIPMLYGGGFMADLDSAWKIVTLRPGNSPIRNLAESLNQTGVLADLVEPEILRLQLIRDTLSKNSEGLNTFYELSGLTDKLLVVVDQFEELFRLQKDSDRLDDESTSFVKLLVAAARNAQIYILVTMRSDFIGACSVLPDLAEVINDGQYLIPRMSRDELAKAISCPVSVVGAKIDPHLVTDLLNFLNDNSSELPVLQHALMRTYECWNRAISQTQVTVRDGVLSIDASGSSSTVNELAKKIKSNCPNLKKLGQSLIIHCWALETIAIDEAQSNEYESQILDNELLQELATKRRQVFAKLSREDRADITERIVKQMLFQQDKKTKQLADFQNCLAAISKLETEDLDQILTRIFRAFWNLKIRAEIPITKNDHFDKVGGMTALSQHAREVCEELVDEKQRLLLIQVFQSLTIIQPDGSQSRRPRSLKQLSAITGASIDELIAVIEPFRRPSCGFIEPPSPPMLNQESVLDILHESLIRVWQDLASWAQEEREFAEHYVRLVQSAYWREKGSGGLVEEPGLSVLWTWFEMARPSPEWANQYNRIYNLPSFKNGSRLENAIAFLQQSKNVAEKRAQDAAAEERNKIEKQAELERREFRKQTERERRERERQEDFRRKRFLVFVGFIFVLAVSAIFIFAIPYINRTRKTEKEQERKITQKETSINKVDQMPGAVDATLENDIKLSRYEKDGFSQFGLGRMREAKELIMKDKSLNHAKFRALINQSLSAQVLDSYDFAVGPQHTKILYQVTVDLNKTVYSALPDEQQRIIQTVWAVTGIFHDDKVVRVPALSILRQRNQILRKQSCFLPLMIECIQNNLENAEGIENSLTVLSKCTTSELKPQAKELLNALEPLERKSTAELRKRLNVILGTVEINTREESADNQASTDENDIPAASATQNENESRQSTVADYEIKCGDWVKAEEKLQSALNIEANNINPEIYGKLGLVHLNLKDNSKAIHDFTKAIGIKPQGRWYRLRGYAYVTKDWTPERKLLAITDYQSALRLNKHDTWARIYLAKAYEFDDNLNEEIENSLDLAIANANTKFERAAAYYYRSQVRRRRHGNSIADYDVAKSLGYTGPINPSIH